MKEIYQNKKENLQNNKDGRNREMTFREQIRNLAGSQSYSRGLQIYNRGKVLRFHIEEAEDVHADENVIIEADVEGSRSTPYHVYLMWNTVWEDLVESECSCPAFWEYDGICKHCVAVLLRYYYETKNRTGQMNLMQIPGIQKGMARKTTGSIQQLLQKGALVKSLPMIQGDICGKVRLEPHMVVENTGITVSFKLGINRMYVLKDVFGFARAIENHEKVFYGKNLQFIHAVESFVPQSRPLVSFLVQWAEKNEYRYGGYHSYYSVYGNAREKQIDLSANDMETFSFNRASCCRLAEGRLMFGSSHGIRSFMVDRTGYKPSSFPLVFTDFKVHNRSLRSMTPEERRRFSEKDVNYTDGITLEYQDNNFTIEFSLLNYVNPQENMYTYRLEGYDDKEIVVDAQRHFATYNNLPTGTYLFRLKGTNEDGVWGNTERTLKVRILPAPWLTWWAYCLYAVAIVVILYFVFRFLRYKMRMQHEIQIGKMEKQKIQEINHLKLQFFTNITHELMTPLSIILASLENLKSGGDKRTLYTVMTANATRLMRLIQQVLEFRKVESGNLKICVSYGDISSFLRSCAEAFIPLLGKRRQLLSFESTPDIIFGFFDADKLDKIVYNLLSNAAKYTPEGGQICVRAALADEYTLQIDVTNTGELMTQKTIDGLFKRFYEGDYRRHNTIGTGIGLALVKDLVALHHGTIEAFSNEQTGNCFRIMLPVDKETYRQEELDETVAAQRQTAFPVPIYINETEEGDEPDEKTELHPEDYTLLIVDDNEELCMLFSNLLSNYFRVKTAINGRQALEVLQEGGIDLVVSDIMMPEMDGIELCRYIKNKFEYCHIPVILLTAKRAEESQIEGYNSGADGYISKPCNFSLLYAQIMNCLKRQERKGADFRKQVVFEVDKLEYTSLDETFLQRAIDCVNAHLNDVEFGQAEFVSEMGASRTVLTEKLKSLTGLTPSAFILNVRLTAACKLMDGRSKIRITDLAVAVGFNDPKYFSTCFKKKYGMTPKEYMEQGKA